MNQEQQLIIETTRRMLSDLCGKEVVDASEQGIWPGNLWHNLEDAGLTLAGIPSELDGSGGVKADSLLVIREAASFAAPVPLSETFIAATMLAGVGEKCPQGPMTVASADWQFENEKDGTKISGQAGNVVFGEYCQHFLLVGEDSVCLLPRQVISLESHNNLAGESVSGFELNQSVPGVRSLKFSDVRFDGPKDFLLHLGAVSRVQMMSGAMTSILGLSVQYALERVQFGKPIAGFQAIQQQLAILAGHVAACQRAADSLLDSPTAFDIAVAKARVGEAVTEVADIAHQVHGAIGYTLEHALNHRTRRLWVWRDEYGNENFWQKQVGTEICTGGAARLWSRITDAA